MGGSQSSDGAADHANDNDDRFSGDASSNSSNNQLTDVQNVPISTTSASSRSASSPSAMTRVISSPSLHMNMMRHIKNRDPFSIYEVIEVLGVGSMGSVSKVRKRRTTIGGSARPHNVSSRFSTVVCDCNPVTGTCSSVPIIGGIFRACCGKRKKHSRGNNVITDSSRSGVSVSSDGNSHVTGSGRSSVFSSLRRKEDILSIQSSGRDRLSGSLHVRRNEKYEICLALKSIHLSRVTDQNFVNELKNEIDLLRSLDHPHIVKPIEVFEYRHQLYFTMEALSGGDLYSRDPYTEGDAARIITAILSAIAYMHSKNIVHRDLKYENVMFVSKSPNADVKLIDFGLSKRYGKDYLRDGVGTIYTMSPEVIRGSYTSKADCWSVGVLLYMLLSSQMPFYGKKRRHVVEKITKCKYDYHGRRWKKISSQARDLVDVLLQVDPEKRPTAEKALQCEWLTQRTQKPEDESYVEAMDNVQATIQNFADYSKLKKLALMVIAHKSTSDEIGFLRQAFQKYDIKKTGIVTLNEFKGCLGDYGYNDGELEAMFAGCDIDGTGQIRYTEFLAATIEAHGAINEEKIAEAFDRLDADDSGFISTKNLREILGKEFPMKDIDNIIGDADLTGDGRISYEEFLCLFDIQQEERRVDALRVVTERRIRNSVLSLSAMNTEHSPSTSSAALSERSFLGGEVSGLDQSGHRLQDPTLTF